MSSRERSSGAVSTLRHRQGTEGRQHGPVPDLRERLEVFGSTRLEDHADRAEQRWGGTPQWAQRQQRTAGYTKQDWLQLRTEQASIHQRLRDAMNDGMPATGPAVMDLAEEHPRSSP